MVSIPDSERLSYALMDASDADHLYDLDQDPAVMKYINGGKITSREEVDTVFLPRMAAYRDSEKGWGLWKISLLESNEFIGWVLVRPMHFFSEQPDWNDWELGWRLKQIHWGYGYATEAARQIMQSLSETQKLERFSAIAMPGNTASISIMKKLGMQYQKTDVHKDPLGDEEVVFYSVGL
ncbi:GNAT family N-acetyltransferase [Marinicella sp. W31]|uniref:GNAT family N-acetyltransferase n=1 Tax=Marinicella sp. W31 TaxID=3023713 RepID=UPI003758154D